MTLQVGDTFDHFQIQEHLAQGGMADVYSAKDLVTGNDVVLKIPDRMMIGDPAQYERFQRELEVTKTLRHPSIQRGLESGQFNRTPYLITEWVDGRSMREIVRSEAPMPVEKAMSLIRKIADGLAYIHDNDVVHRDLKPENILLTKDGQPIIIDFGLALTKGGRRVTYANLSATAGTPDYMAPEQVEGQRGDKRTDIYSLGIMLYELLTSKPPFTADSNMAVMAQHLRGAIPRLDKEQPNISPQIAAVVALALQKNPDDRYRDMHAFIEALDHPETVDISILDKITGTATALPFWRSQAFIAAMMGIALIVVLVVVALALQGLRSP